MERNSIDDYSFGIVTKHVQISLRCAVEFGHKTSQNDIPGRNIERSIALKREPALLKKLCYLRLVKAKSIIPKLQGQRTGLDDCNNFEVHWSGRF